MAALHGNVVVALALLAAGADVSLWCCESEMTAVVVYEARLDKEMLKS